MPEDRIWFGRPMVALESYMDLLQRVAQLELLVKLALDSIDLIQHAQRIHKGLSTRDDVPRETEEVHGQQELPLEYEAQHAAPPDDLGQEQDVGRPRRGRRDARRRPGA